MSDASEPPAPEAGDERSGGKSGPRRRKRALDAPVEAPSTSPPRRLRRGHRSEGADRELQPQPQPEPQGPTPVGGGGRDSRAGSSAAPARPSSSSGSRPSRARSVSISALCGTDSPAADPPTHGHLSRSGAGVAPSSVGGPDHDGTASESPSPPPRAPRPSHGQPPPPPAGATAGPLSGLAASIAQLPPPSFEFVAPSRTEAPAPAPGPRLRSSAKAQATPTPSSFLPPPISLSSFSAHPIPPPRAIVLPPPPTYLVAPHPSARPARALHAQPSPAELSPPRPAPQRAAEASDGSQAGEHASSAAAIASSRDLAPDRSCAEPQPERSRAGVAMDELEPMRGGLAEHVLDPLGHMSALAARSLQLREELVRIQEESLRFVSLLAARPAPCGPIAIASGAHGSPSRSAAPAPLQPPPPCSPPRPQLMRPPGAFPAPLNFPHTVAPAAATGAGPPSLELLRGAPSASLLPPPPPLARAPSAASSSNHAQPEHLPPRHGHPHRPASEAGPGLGPGPGPPQPGPGPPAHAPPSPPAPLSSSSSDPGSFAARVNFAASTLGLPPTSLWLPPQPPGHMAAPRPPAEGLPPPSRSAPGAPGLAIAEWPAPISMAPVPWPAGAPAPWMPPPPPPARAP
eukprot:tig00021720_g23173.t1